MPDRAIFLFDGPNFYKNMKHAGIERGHLSFSTLARNLAGPRTITDIIFFTSPTDSQTDAQNYANQQRFFAALQNDGIILKLGHLVNKTSECPSCAHTSHYKTEKSVDVQLAMHLTIGCCENMWDVAYLASCDTDLVPAVDYVRSKGKKVFLLLPSGARCYNMSKACSATIPITQDKIDAAQCTFNP